MAFKQRKFRSKVSAEDEEGEDGPPPIRPPQPQPKKDQAAVKPVPNAGSLGASKPDAKKDSKGSKLNLLSFEDGGDDPGFVPKKDSKRDKNRQSKLARAPPLPDLPTDTAPQTLRSTAGEYTAERLRELQRNAISFSAARLTADVGGGGGGGAAEGAGGGGSSEPVIKLSGSFKPAGAAKDDRFSQPGSSLALVQPQMPEEAMPLPPPPRPGGGPPPATQPPAAVAAAAAPKQQPEEDEEDDGGIPDQQTILAAKAKRERLRQAHLAPDYIPTSGLGMAIGRLRPGATGPGPGGRGGSVGPGGSGSAAEGGGGGGASGSDSDAEAEETMRIRFSGKEAGRPRKDLSQYTQAAGGDDDEEAFAREQLRKALRLQQVGGAGVAAPPGAAAATAAASGGDGYAAVTAAAMQPPAFAAAGFVGGSRLAAITSAGDAAVAALAEGLRRLQISHRQVQQNCLRTADNLAAALGRVEGLEVELRAAGDKYEYMQRLRAYVADLCDCLQVKSAIVEELEDTRLELMEDRAQAARTAAANAERDLMAPAEAAAAAAMTALGRGAGAAAAGAAAESAARDAEDALLDEEGPEEVDEFGRNVNLQRRRELEARAADRKRLLAREGERLAAAQSGAAIQPLPAEGEAGDAQSSRYEIRYREIKEAGGTVFADADEEFASIGAVKQRLEEWKARYPKDYTNAYMHLSNPALFAPYVRLELLHWDPLYGTAEGAPYKGFDSLEWYGQLFEYGMSPAADGAAAAAMPDDDPDADLVPQLVRKLVLPLVLHWIERCWDVRDVAQTRAVAALASELLVYVPAEEGRMTELLAAVRGALEAAVEAAAAGLPPWPPAVLAAVPRAAIVLFRRFRAALTVLAAVAAFEGLLARGLLTGLALGRLVCGQMMPYLRAAAAGGGGGEAGGGGGLAFAVATVEAVAVGLHPDWFAAGPLPEGAVLLEHAVWLGKALEQQQQHQQGRAGGGGAEVAALAGRLAGVMVRLGDAARGRRLAAAFGLRGV